jgi:hypothetical protein
MEIGQTTVSLTAERYVLPVIERNIQKDDFFQNNIMIGKMQWKSSDTCESVHIAKLVTLNIPNEGLCITFYRQLILLMNSPFSYDLRGKHRHRRAVPKM